MEEQVFQQAANVAGLPGIVKASYAMPDAHWGYGFPIGGVGGVRPGPGRRDLGGRGRLRHFLRRAGRPHRTDRG